MSRLALLLAAGLALAGCALRPLYAGGDSSAVAGVLRSVEVQPIGGSQVGWLVRTALVDRLRRNGAQPALYRLEVEIDDSIIGLALRRDAVVTRERRTLRARYRLVEIARGTVVLDATAGSEAGIDVVSSEYATVAAEQSAAERLASAVADQIVARLGLYAARTTRSR